MYSDWFLLTVENIFKNFVSRPGDKHLKCLQPRRSLEELSISVSVKLHVPNSVIKFLNVTYEPVNSLNTQLLVSKMSNYIISDSLFRNVEKYLVCIVGFVFLIRFRNWFCIIVIFNIYWVFVLGMISIFHVLISLILKIVLWDKCYY